MKKIVIALLALFLLQGIAVAQRQTDPTTIKRATVWDIPRTNKFLLAKDMKPVLAFVGKNPVYILANQETYDMIVKKFDSASLANVPEGKFKGIEFPVDYIEDFSLYSKSELKNLPLTDEQRIVYEAFNKKAKYTILAQSPYVVYGTKIVNPDTGEVWIRQDGEQQIVPGTANVQQTGTGPIDRNAKNNKQSNKQGNNQQVDHTQDQ